MRSVILVTLSVVALLGTACGDDDATRPPPTPTPEGCNPLAHEWDCLLPFPSDHFLVDDAAMPSGRRIELPEAAQLRGMDGPIDLYALHPSDGFPISPPILVRVEGGVDETGLVPVDDPARSLEAGSTTVLIDADTGERVLHFAELDPIPNPNRQALIVRPIVRLRDGVRYVVGLRGLTHPDESPVEAPRNFRALRDGEPSDDPALEGAAARFEADVFAPLAAAGVAREELILAWDFTSRTEENATGDMLRVREATMAWLETNTPALAVVSVDDVPDDDRIAARIEATFTAPLFVESTELGAALNRDATGAVAQNGTVEVPFTILVPPSVAARGPGDPPARLMQFGHGFFGSREEVVGGYVPELAEERGFVAVCTDWWGMSGPDREDVGSTIAFDPPNTGLFTDRVHQAMANQLVLARAALGPLADLAELRDAAGPIFDPGALYWLGISQGHILGGTYLALAPDVDRGVLNVGGANLSLITFRALPFIPFLLILATVVVDELERQKLSLMIQSSFDRVDPMSYAPHLVDDLYPGGPAERRVLMSVGVADPAVSSLAGQLHARGAGATHLTPAPRVVVGLATSDGPIDGGAAYVEHDFGIPEEPRAVAPDNNDVHEGVRRLDAFKEQLDRFLRPGGVVEHTCMGPCDPE